MPVQRSQPLGWLSFLALGFAFDLAAYQLRAAARARPACTTPITSISAT